ncbi:MAG TPA: glycosyltransferase family 39 protein [Polyangiaceae bacterium]|nr:glycosyltransferase family 39 protein [Polyangiaceae bacterium]
MSTTSTPSSTTPPSTLQRWIDRAIGAGLFGGYLGALLSSVENLGYARDEGFYFHAARTYGKWFQLLISDRHEALRRSVIDSYWQENHEHPSLMKSLFALSQRFFEGVLFEERGTAYRFPALVLAALTVLLLFVWGRRAYGRAGGIVAALAFACMPRVFYNSHLACFDLPITAFWVFVVFAYQRSFETRKLRWGLCAGVLYGLALATKHNSWAIPPALCAHVLVQHVLGLRRPWKRNWYRIHIPSALVFMALLSPLLFYGLWPWIWTNTVERLREYVAFHMQHVFYNMEFLGRTYFKPPFPRSYAWLMTLATVPAATLWLAGLGALATLRSYWSERARRRATPESHQDRPPDPTAWPPIDRGARDGAPSLWLLCMLASYSFWWSTSTPIFGGTKHWMPAYPFLALFAGAGFALLQRALARWLERAWAGRFVRYRPLAEAALGASLLSAPLLMTWHSHPWGLSFYTPLVGGAPGAATLGLNRTFWGYTTGALQSDINELAGPDARVYIHDTAMDSFKMLQRDGRLRGDLKPWTTVSGSALALYHHEQHMSRVEHMIWVDYGTVAPVRVGGLDGVPVVYLYQRPQ